MSARLPVLEKFIDDLRTVWAAESDNQRRMERAKPLLEHLLALQAIEWVILGRFWTNFEFLSSVIVVAVGMWATRLRCPSCPQRFWMHVPLIFDEAVAPPAGRQGASRTMVQMPGGGYRAGGMQVRILSRRYSSSRKP